MKKIFVDLDGVIFDFNKRYEDYFGLTPAQVRVQRKDYRVYWKEFIQREGFANLSLHAGARELIEYLRSLKGVGVYILTSSGGFDNHGAVQRQKIECLWKHGITWSPIVVPGRRYKAAYADPDSLLIDDTAGNVNDFIAAGGVAVLHTNAESTIVAVNKWLWLP